MSFIEINKDNEIIDNYSITNKDFELFYDFMSSEHIYNLYYNSTKEEFIASIPFIVNEWFNFLHQRRNPSLSNEVVFGGNIYRATFGKTYTLEQLAKSPLHYSRGSNGSGLYTVTNSNAGIKYLKGHLTKRFYPFDDKIGNILKIGVNDNAIVLNKIKLTQAKERFIEEIKMAKIPKHQKKAYIALLMTDISIVALLLNADMIFIPSSHILVLNKKSLILPTSPEQLNAQTLQVDLEKFRIQDEKEHQLINDFLSK